ncbi:unnamed protein product, partial [Adineta ricciae]
SLGHFYNAFNDSLTDFKENHVNYIQKENFFSKKCFVKRGNEIELQNLLELLGFDNELRLSLLSHLISSSGISSIVNYPYLIDENTRLVYYSLITQRTYIKENDFKSMKSTNESTHFIKEIFHGIEFLILLRVNRDSNKFIDPLLDDFCQSLNKSTNLSNKYSNEQISLFSIYSNIPFLTEKRTIQEIYDSVRPIESNLDRHWPLTYILHPIKTSKSNLYYPIR